MNANKVIPASFSSKSPHNVSVSLYYADLQVFISGVVFFFAPRTNLALFLYDRRMSKILRALSDLNRSSSLSDHKFVC